MTGIGGNMRRRFGLAFCALAVFAASSAIGQWHDPAADWTTGVSPASPERTAEAMREYTSCIARTMRRRSIALLSMPYPSAEASTETLALAQAGDGCLDLFRVRFEERMLRGGLFEAFYRRDFPVAGAPRRRTSVAVHPSDLAMEDWRRQTNCVVARDGAGSDAFIRTYPGTDAERRALQPLIAAVRDCARETGVSISELRRFRGAMAESLYLSRAGETAQAADDGE